MFDFAFWYTIVVLVLMIISLIFEIFKSEISLFTALILLTLGGVISINEAFRGFSNPAVLSIGFLYVIAFALQSTGALSSIAKILFGQKPGSISIKLLRFMLPIASVSAFLNNTPIVAMFIPVVKSWCRSRNFAPSKFLIPLSFATLLGGTCTLIGTNTNMVVQGFLLAKGHKGFSFFELGVVGVPVSIVGLLLLAFVIHRFLPNRKEAVIALGEKTREFVIEMKVDENYGGIGKTIEEAGLRHLQGLFLFQIERHGEVIAPIPPTERIHLNDRLFFTGLPATIVELQKQRGLNVVKDKEYDLKNYDSSKLKTFEVVISESSPLIGKTVRESNFRREYDAVILAIHRNGERINKKVGDIEFKIGDTLLILADKDFYNRWYHSRDFYLVSTSEEIPSRQKFQTIITIVISIAMIITVASNIFPLVLASAIAVTLLILIRCVSTVEAFNSIEWNILIVIASSFGIGAGLENSGVAQFFAMEVIKFSQPFGVIALISAVYFTTVALTELVTNSAAAAVLFPIAYSIAEQSHHDLMPFVYAVTFGASYGFASPIGYQTHMMVYGAGGYHFKDFLKVGIPMDLIIGAIVVGIIYFVFF